MQAIILAAGMGRRLKEYTENNTKCMVKVNGITLIERLLRQLDKKMFSRIILVIGYKGDKLKCFVDSLNIATPIYYIDNPVYEKTNNIYSLSLAKEYLMTEDTILFESDIICEEPVIDSLIEDQRGTLALVDKYEPWMDGTCLKLDEEDNIVDFVSGKNFDFNKTSDCYKTVNIYKFSKAFSRKKYVPFMEAYLTALGENEYYEQVLRVITVLSDREIKAKRLDGQKWYEIDDIQDLDIAEALFCTDDDEKVRKMAGRYGGYWRFPHMLDYCYLVNPFYPPQKLIDEMKASFERLIREYPSGMRVNSLLASKNFGVAQDNIVVGNGAAELIKSFLEQTKGKVGFIKPTFEEYPNRYDKNNSVIFEVRNKDFHYTADEVMEYFADKNIQTLILINPDNPSGNYIGKSDLIRLIKWAGQRNIRVVVDESFVDFASEKDSTLIRQGILNDNKNLIVIKSISKSYGVPGLRLGILACAEIEMIEKIRRDVSIWNINSFAEFYLQIAEKYKDYYDQGLVKFRDERVRFYEKLSEIKGLRVIPSEANYFMAELTNGQKAHKLTTDLLVGYSILIKDLSEKLTGGEYIRLAIRSPEENDMMVKALQSVIAR